MGSGGVAEGDLACLGELVFLDVELVDGVSVVGDAEGGLLHVLFEDLGHLLLGLEGEVDSGGVVDACLLEAGDYVVAVLGLVDVGGLEPRPSLVEEFGVSDDGGYAGSSLEAVHVDEVEGVVVSLDDGYDVVVYSLGEVYAHVEVACLPCGEWVVLEVLVAAFGEEVLGEPGVCLLDELDLELCLEDEGAILAGLLYLPQVVWMIDSLLGRLSPGDGVLLVVGVLVELVEDAVLSPGGAGGDDCAAGGGQHGREDVFEYGFVVPEEGGLVGYDEVGGESPELVLGVGQEQDLAAVPEPVYRL